MKGKQLKTASIRLYTGPTLQKKINRAFAQSLYPRSKALREILDAVADYMLTHPDANLTRLCTRIRLGLGIHEED